MMIESLEREHGHDPWATLDGLTMSEPCPATETVGRVAFYGRCSTEDHQDPQTSQGWQLSNARRFVEPLGGRVVAEFFDVGQSRSVPSNRRPHAASLLAQLKQPVRDWDAVVVGEGTRCWFGNQFSLTAPRFTARGVELWVPELGGRYDDRNPSHKMLMSVLGGMSESERQHVQARVRAAMDTQVVNEGRHQGGRAPYGYHVVDGGPHPHPRKAAEGHRQRILAIDPEAAEVVRRIYAEYLDGIGMRAIAARLNRDGIACPSARRPEQNRHRSGDGWQSSSVRVILDNPRYTGYAVFGRSRKHEVLIDPDDVAAGHVVRFRRAEPDRIVRSREPAHPAIVSVDTFTLALLQRRSRSAGGIHSLSKLERTRAAGPGRYLLRGIIRCGLCGRRMHGDMIRGHDAYYRCLARTMAPDSPALADHPRTVNVRERDILAPVDAWICDLFAPDQLDSTIASVLSPTPRTAQTELREITGKLAEAEECLRRLRRAISAGVEPAALVDDINAAHLRRATARADLDRVTTATRMTAVQTQAAARWCRDVSAAIADPDPERRAQLYQTLGLELTFHPGDRTVRASIAPRITGSDRRPASTATVLQLPAAGGGCR